LHYKIGCKTRQGFDDGDAAFQDSKGPVWLYAECRLAIQGRDCVGTKEGEDSHVKGEGGRFHAKQWRSVR
jgi:hypothetical protein